MPLFVFGLLGMAALAVCFAPGIIARTPLKQQILPALLPDYPGAIDLGAASLDWMSPVTLKEITLRDLTGEPFVQIPVARTEKSLLDLVLNRSDAGKVILEGPQVRIVVRDGGSNLEDVLRPMLDASNEPSTSGLKIESSAGTLELYDAEGRRSARVANIALLFARSFEPSMAL
ncbi:MAG: hypothetical protein AB7O26_16310, partial [Planctomycetaceae bacterium]